MTFTSPSAVNKNNIFHIRARKPCFEYTTGLMENTPAEGIWPTTSLAVLIDNEDPAEVCVQISGYYLSGAENRLYVLELFSLNPGEVVTRNYYAQFRAFKFRFKTSSQDVDISAWGKNSTGNLVAAHRVLPAEFKVSTLSN